MTNLRFVAYLRNYISPYVPLDPQRFKRALEYMRDKDERVLRATTVTLVIDYPLSVEYREELRACSGVFTRLELCLAVARAYERIYKEEEDTASHTGRPLPGALLLNRRDTDGRWGIRGHDLSDLLLYTIAFDPAKNELSVGVDS